MKALELSCKTQPEVNQQNNLPTQTILDQIAELNKNIVKMSQNPMGMPPIDSVHQDEYDSSFQDFNQSMNSISLSWQKIGDFAESNTKKGLGQKEAEKKAQWKGQVKGEIKHIKMGIKKHWEEDDITEGLKYTKNHLPQIRDFFENHDDLLQAKGNESDILLDLLGANFIPDFE